MALDQIKLKKQKKAALEELAAYEDLLLSPEYTKTYWANLLDVTPTCISAFLKDNNKGIGLSKIKELISLLKKERSYRRIPN